MKVALPPAKAHHSATEAAPSDIWASFLARQSRWERGHWVQSRGAFRSLKAIKVAGLRGQRSKINKRCRELVLLSSTTVSDLSKPSTQTARFPEARH